MLKSVERKKLRALRPFFRNFAKEIAHCGEDFLLRNEQNAVKILQNYHLLRNNTNNGNPRSVIISLEGSFTGSKLNGIYHHVLTTKLPEDLLIKLLGHRNRAVAVCENYCHHAVFQYRIMRTWVEELLLIVHVYTGVHQSLYTVYSTSIQDTWIFSLQ